MKRCVVITSFGDRVKQVKRLVKSIRSFCDYDIVLYCSENISDAIKGQGIISYISDYLSPHDKEHYRWAIRTSNYFKSYAVKKNMNYQSFCCLDDDMVIVNKCFVEGFSIAERFGVACPINPRLYVKYNAMGEDVKYSHLLEVARLGIPKHATAVNMSPLFVCRVNENGKKYNDILFDLLGETKNVCRGTLLMNKASWISGVTPFYLPETWCVCGGNAEHWKNYKCRAGGITREVELVMLHAGHKKVKEVFGL